MYAGRINNKSVESNSPYIVYSDADGILGEADCLADAKAVKAEKGGQIYGWERDRKVWFRVRALRNTIFSRGERYIGEF